METQNLEHLQEVWRSEIWMPPFTSCPVSQGTDMKTRHWVATGSRISEMGIVAGEMAPCKISLKLHSKEKAPMWTEARSTVCKQGDLNTLETSRYSQTNKWICVGFVFVLFWMTKVVYSSPYSPWQFLTTPSDFLVGKQTQTCFSWCLSLLFSICLQ